MNTKCKMLSLLGFTLLVLSACAPALTWNRANTSDEQSAADLRTCRNEAAAVTVKPQLADPPVYGDRQLTTADNELSDALTNFFVMRLDAIKAQNRFDGSADEESAEALVIEFGFAESSALRAELERSLAGRQVYARAARDDLGQRIEATYSRVLSLVSSTPDLDLNAEWAKLDEINASNGGLTSAEAINQAFNAYNDSAEDYLYAQNEPLLEPYRAELSSRTESCMLALGYQAP